MPLLLIVILGSALSSTFRDSSPADVGGASLRGCRPRPQRCQPRLIGFFAGTSAFKVSELPSPIVGEGLTWPQGDRGPRHDSGGVWCRRRRRTRPKVALSSIDNNVDNLRAAQLAIDNIGDADPGGDRGVGNCCDADGTTPWGTTSHGTSTAADPAAGLNGITYYTVTMIVLILIYGLANTWLRQGGMPVPLGVATSPPRQTNSPW